MTAAVHHHGQRRVKGLIPLTAAMLGSLAVLIGLGLWQLERLAWKESLTARIEARVTAPPKELADALAHLKVEGEAEYLRVQLTGRFDHAQEFHLYWFRREPGYRIITPMTVEAPGGTIVLVDRGFVPERLKSPASRPEPDARVTVIGLIRVPPRDPGSFAPQNDPAKNVWHWVDLPAMGSLIQRPPASTITPFIVELEAGQAAPPGPQGGLTRLDLSNRHLEYSLTWFGLAGALLSVYGVMVWGRLFPRPTQN